MALKVSIITVTRNEASLLERALYSVAEQTYPEIEHIVVDGCSIDDTEKVVSRYPHARFVRRKPAGIYDAINFGLESATGDILGLIHGNDRLASADVIAKVASEFEADPELDFIFGDLRYVSPKDYAPSRIYHADKFRPVMLQGGIQPPHPTLYLRKSVFENVGPYSCDYGSAGDFEYWARLFSKRSLKWKYIPCMMVDMTSGGRSTTVKARLFTNNYHKLRALRANGFCANPLLLLWKYWQVARDVIIDFIKSR